MTHRNQIRVTAKSLIVLIAVFFGTAASADGAQFRIAFEDVSGSTELETGNIDKGIEILEAAYAEGSVDEGAALATLCGAYLLNHALVEAKAVCRKAAKNYPSQSSLNNYGIYLAVVGNFEGAIKNLKKVQPLERAEYLEYLRTKDIGLIALQNEAVVRDQQFGNKTTRDESIRLFAEIEELAP